MKKIEIFLTLFFLLQGTEQLWGMNQRESRSPSSSSSEVSSGSSLSNEEIRNLINRNDLPSHALAVWYLQLADPCTHKKLKKAFKKIFKKFPKDTRDENKDTALDLVYKLKKQAERIPCNDKIAHCETLIKTLTELEVPRTENFYLPKIDLSESLDDFAERIDNILTELSKTYLYFNLIFPQYSEKDIFDNSSMKEVIKKYSGINNIICSSIIPREH